MKTYSRQEILQQYNLTIKWFYALSLDGYITKIKRNTYIIEKQIDFEKYKDFHEQRRRQKIIAGNKAFAANMTAEEKEIARKKNSEGQKRRLAIPENREKHKQRQKKCMSNDTARRNVGLGSSRSWKNSECRQRRIEAARISTTKSWKNPECRQNRISGLRNAYITRGEDILSKIHATKMKHGTYNSSSQAEYCIKQLQLLGYTIELEKEYPLNPKLHCDVYIVELDTWIEFHFYWSHGGKLGPFNNTNKTHLEQLKFFQENSNKRQYKNAIYTWTDLDVRKRQCAIDNNLKYYCFYSPQQFEEFLIRLKELV